MADGVVYVGSWDGNVYALKASTGALLWSFASRHSDSVESSPAVANGLFMSDRTTALFTPSA